MANAEHLGILEQGWKAWNQWRSVNSSVTPDLSDADIYDVHSGDVLNMIVRTLFSHHRFEGINLNGANVSRTRFHKSLYGADFGQANLSNAKLEGLNLNHTNFERANLSGANLAHSRLLNANLNEANLSGAILVGSDLEGADLSQAILSGADLTGANLARTRMVRTNLEGGNITNCSIYGLSTWDVNLDGAIQSNLVISPKDTPVVTVDNLEVAQFIYLLLNNQKIRDVINTLGQKAVLILGRFSPERKTVLDAIADALRQRNFLPIVFDFEKSEERDFTETVMVLAGLSLFVIADITNPKASPLELHATVPNYMIPFVPIIQEGESPFSMFVDLQKFDWVLNVVIYDNLSNLLTNLDAAVINPALSKHNELIARKANKLRITHINEFTSPE